MKCPDCDSSVVEMDVDLSTYSDSQAIDYQSGFNRQVKCKSCSYHGLAEVPVYSIPGEDEIYNPDINPERIEGFIVSAINKCSFVEATTLIHNVIEFYLLHRLFDHVLEINNLSREDFNSDNATLPNNIRIIQKILFDKDSRGYLLDRADTCLIFGLISVDIYSSIKKFNSRRNIVIHKLLKSGNDTTYETVGEIVKLGREIQLRLSPLQHYLDERIQMMKTKIDQKIEELQEEDHLYDE